jgi:hypothetical protein
MAWRVAKSLLLLREQIDSRYPNRSKSSDGTIGNAEHSSRTSDHNPNNEGVVCALDITNDPAHGLRSREVAEALVASKDRRIKYIISNGEICSGFEQGKPPWIWRKYKGANPHTHHFHISVRGEKKFYDDMTTWDLADAPKSLPAPETPWQGVPMLRKGIVGDDVVRLQKILNAYGAKLDTDGEFGSNTQKAVKAFQKARKIVADGVVGPYTWGALRDWDALVSSKAKTPLIGW